MKYRILMLLLFPILISCSLLYNNEQEVGGFNNEPESKDSLIQWSSNLALEWQDFLGFPPDTGEYKDFTAVSWVQKRTTKWKLTDNEILFECVCYFNRYLSWSKEGGANLLKHERGHFDIVELNMRTFRKQCINHRSLDLQATVDFFYHAKELMFENIQKQQDLYDHETNFSKNMEEQKKWNQKITNILKETEEWSDTKVVIRRYDN